MVLHLHLEVNKYGENNIGLTLALISLSNWELSQKMINLEDFWVTVFYTSIEEIPWKEPILDYSVFNNNFRPSDFPSVWKVSKK